MVHKYLATVGFNGKAIEVPLTDDENYHIEKIIRELRGVLGNLTRAGVFRPLNRVLTFKLREKPANSSRLVYTDVEYNRKVKLIRTKRKEDRHEKNNSQKNDIVMVNDNNNKKINKIEYTEISQSQHEIFENTWIIKINKVLKEEHKIFKLAEVLDRITKMNDNETKLYEFKKYCEVRKSYAEIVQIAEMLDKETLSELASLKVDLTIKSMDVGYNLAKESFSIMNLIDSWPKILNHYDLSDSENSDLDSYNSHSE